MKSIGFILSYLATPQARRSARILGWMLAALAVIVALYSVLFHVIMDHEGQSFSWVTSVYWTLVTMSTLGYGDIAFESDLGRLYSLVVLLSGSVFILVLLPFTFIQFVFLPWMESTQRARAPRRVGDDVRDHVMFTGTGAIESALLGTALARRVLAPDGRSQVIGEFGELLVAEAAAPDDLVGRSLAETRIRQRTGLTVGGVWERGALRVARPTTVLESSSILVLAGSRRQLDAYDELFTVEQARSGRVVVIGGGRVGRAVARHLGELGNRVPDRGEAGRPDP